MIEKRSFNFALKIILLTQSLKEDRQYLIADQLLKSATSVGANVSEAGAGQTKKDFIAKCPLTNLLNLPIIIGTI
jgi:four helix bundle protein